MCLLLMDSALPDPPTLIDDMQGEYDFVEVKFLPLSMTLLLHGPAGDLQSQEAVQRVLFTWCFSHWRDVPDSKRVLKKYFNILYCINLSDSMGMSHIFDLEHLMVETLGRLFYGAWLWRTWSTGSGGDCPWPRMSVWVLMVQTQRHLLRIISGTDEGGTCWTLERADEDTCWVASAEEEEGREFHGLIRHTTSQTSGQQS